MHPFSSSDPVGGTLCSLRIFLRNISTAVARRALCDTPPTANVIVGEAMRKATSLLVLCLAAVISACGDESSSGNSAGSGGLGGTGGLAGSGGAGGTAGGAGEGGRGGEVGAECGDGVAVGDEECDGEDLRGATCASLDMGTGALGCSESCAFDTSACDVPQECGNGVVEGSERCDGADFGSDSCELRGFARGPLSCTESCEVDISNCDVPIVQESEPNDNRTSPTPVSVPSVGKGAISGGDEDYWAIPVTRGARYRIRSTLDLAGGCDDAAQDSSFAYSDSGADYSIDVDIDDIDSAHRCALGEITSHIDGTVIISVFAWSPTLTYYLWVEEI